MRKNKLFLSIPTLCSSINAQTQPLLSRQPQIATLSTALTGSFYFDANSINQRGINNATGWAFMATMFYLLLAFSNVRAQDKYLNIYNNETEIKAPGSITLTDGFFIPAGKNVRIFTDASFKQCAPFVSTPSANLNYVATRVFRVEGVNNTNIDDARSICEVNQTIQYLDGIGRPLQTVSVQASPGGLDIVQPYSYDLFGRSNVKYQPYTESGNVGGYRTDALQPGRGLEAFYANPPVGVTLTNSPLARTTFEPSPLNRVLEQSAPGAAWRSEGNYVDYGLNTQKIAYDGNVANEVRIWVMNSADNGATGISYYPEYTLHKQISKDENWKSSHGKAGTTEEFKDINGTVLLKRTWETNTKSLSTYYVYDDMDNLRYVLPPELNENGGSTLTSFNESQTVFANHVYAYKYDGFKRLIEKKIPGKGWVYLVYNEFDQLVMSQEALQRDHNDQDWLVNKYDKFGRQVITGLYKHAGSIAGTDYRAAIQANVDAAPPGSTPGWEIFTGEGDGYTSSGSYNSFPFALNNLLLVNYYDNYTFPGASGLLAQGTVSQMTKGLATGTKTYTTDGMAAYLSVNYYDDEGRVKEVIGQNHVGGTDRIVNTYSFTNELLSSTRTHIEHSRTTSIANTYSYDHMGRKRQSSESINGAIPIILSRLTYNELGQLKDKELHSTNDGSSFLNKSTYSYNARGWLKEQVNPLFNMTLQYEDGAVPQFNGNISGQQWGPAAAPALHNYAYLYDNLNRLKSGVSDEGFNESLSYDSQGNILSLSRNPMGTNTYLYNGNQLSSISGFVNGSYLYDVNGNLKSDGPKNITLEYNYLNLPVNISKPGESMQNTFLANGAKLKKTVGGLTREYAGGIEYNNGEIEFIQTEEGRARPNGGSYFYEYLLKDHLGNTRVMLDQNGTVLESSDYYPFGLQVARAGHTVPSPENRYKYNGKELQTELGLMQYDYGARFYDPVIGRWNVVDPLAEKMRRFSPYVYGNNNPIRFIDPDGMEADDIRFRDKNNHLIATYYTDKVEKDVKIENVDVKKDLNINLNKITDKLPDVDVIGINFGGEFTVGGGVTVATQFAYFLDGKDLGHGAFFNYAGGNLGVSVGAGISAFAGDYIGSLGDKNFTMNDYLGNTAAYNIGIEAESGSYWWGNNLKSGQPELYPGMGAIYDNKDRYQQTWSGYSLGGAVGTPQLKAGLSISHGVTSYFESANRKLGLNPYTKGYQK